MIDINTIFNNAIAAAVDAHIMAIQQQHANIVGELAQRIATLEQQLSTIGVTDIINAAIDARIEAVLERTDRSLEVNIDALRELVKPMIDSVVEQAIADHCEEYDHDSYDNVVNAVDDMGDLPDFDDFVTKSDLESQMSDAIQEAVGNLTFDITVR